MTKFLILTILFSINAFSNCDYVDLRDDSLGENRNQKDIAWCYAYTMSDLINFKLKGPKLSAADTAMTYNNHNLPRVQHKLVEAFNKIFLPNTPVKEHETGFMALSFISAKKRGLCTEEIMPSPGLFRYEETAFGITKTHVEMFDASIEIHQQRKNVHYALKHNTSYKDNVYFLMNNMTKRDYFSILESASKDSMFFEFSKIACKNNRISIPENLNARYFFLPLNPFKIIDDQLNQKNIVGIDYNSNVLENIKPRGLSLHASSIVGRRFNSSTKQCEYLIRNSYGSSCDGYDSHLECDQGNLWIAKKYLRPVLYDVIYLD